MTERQKGREGLRLASAGMKVEKEHKTRHARAKKLCTGVRLNGISDN